MMHCSYRGVFRTILPLLVCRAEVTDGPVCGCCPSGTVSAGGCRAASSVASFYGSKTGSSCCWFISDASGMSGGEVTGVILVVPLHGAR